MKHYWTELNTLICSVFTKLRLGRYRKTGFARAGNFLIGHCWTTLGKRQVLHFFNAAKTEAAIPSRVLVIAVGFSGA